MRNLIAKIKSYRQAKKFLPPLRCLLSNGIYYYRHDTISKIFIKNFYKIFLLPSLFIVKTKNKYAKLEYGKVCFGTQKICLINNGYVYSAFKHPNFYTRMKNNANATLKDFNYPCSKLNEFNDEFKIYKTQEIQGRHVKTDVDMNLIVDQLLELSLNSTCKKVENGILYVLQHGDPNPSNIFINDKKITFIDIGAIKLRTALFDFFYFLIFTNNFKSLSIFTKKYYEKIKEIFQKNNIKYVENTIDEYLYYFTEFYLNLPTGKVDFLTKMFNDNECTKYPKTYELLRKEL